MALTSPKEQLSYESDLAMRRASRKVSQAILGQLAILDPEARVALLEMTKDFLVDRVLAYEKSKPAEETEPEPSPEDKLNAIADYVEA